MTVLRVDSSIRYEGSVSRELTAKLAGDDAVHRDLAAMRGLEEAWREAVLGEPGPLVAELADEVAAADAIVVGVPVYDLGIPAVVKSWLGLVIADPRFNPRTALGSALAGVPVTLVAMALRREAPRPGAVVGRRVGGWWYGPGSPVEGWNHAIPYLRRMFADVFGADVTLEVVEGTVQNAARPQAPV
ncbi:NAD(P)H-dependent oxidoreductase [Amycolatopsis sp. GM8]|uniref:NAD(P)H-dependent oxidoreductase n=1 Tax=Amycolatopsis sp. GM8 TaxID=2896530 RepID=UPI001F35D363|nr:NAD(P)H-dependent oxidoreductase [Amycolatopsis sp. GM8]